MSTDTINFYHINVVKYVTFSWSSYANTRWYDFGQTRTNLNCAVTLQPSKPCEQYTYGVYIPTLNFKFPLVEISVFDEQQSKSLPYRSLNYRLPSHQMAFEILCWDISNIYTVGQVQKKNEAKMWHEIKKIKSKVKTGRLLLSMNFTALSTSNGARRFLQVLIPNVPSTFFRFDIFCYYCHS